MNGNLNPGEEVEKEEIVQEFLEDDLQREYLVGRVGDEEPELRGNREEVLLYLESLGAERQEVFVSLVDPEKPNEIASHFAVCGDLIWESIEYVNRV